MLNRRRFLQVVNAGLVAARLTAGAQPASRLARLGYLDHGTAARQKPYLDALKLGLRELGWVEGQNIAIEPRYADGKTDQLPRLAAELVRLKMDVIATSSTPAALAAKHATTRSRS